MDVDDILTSKWLHHETCAIVGCRRGHLCGTNVRQAAMSPRLFPAYPVVFTIGGLDGCSSNGRLGV
uniref:Uncharacterized protein n=2 Tax=Leersia perrieri TaxID=77586 RepID=A0A0D9WGW6_9ORYZ